MRFFVDPVAIVRGSLPRDDVALVVSGLPAIQVAWTAIRNPLLRVGVQPLLFLLSLLSFFLLMAAIAPLVRTISSDPVKLPASPKYFTGLKSSKIEDLQRCLSSAA